MTLEEELINLKIKTYEKSLEFSAILILLSFISYLLELFSKNDFILYSLYVLPIITLYWLITIFFYLFKTNNIEKNITKIILERLNYLE